MTIENIINTAKNYAGKTAMVVAIGTAIALGGCMPVETNKTNTAEEATEPIGAREYTETRELSLGESYRAHKISVADLKKNPGKYLDRPVRLEGVLVEQINPNEYNNNTWFILRSNDEEKPYFVTCIVEDTSYKNLVARGILSSVEKENEKGRMYTITLDGEFKKDDQTNSYWFSVHRVKELDTDRFLAVGDRPSDYKPWKSK